MLRSSTCAIRGTISGHNQTSHPHSCKRKTMTAEGFDLIFARLFRWISPTSRQNSLSISVTGHPIDWVTGPENVHPIPRILSPDDGTHNSVGYSVSPGGSGAWRNPREAKTGRDGNPRRLEARITGNTT